MGTITARSIVGKAATVLQDVSHVRWSETELFGWLNDGQREIVLLKADANAVNESVQLDAGTRQTIPDQGISLIEVVRNTGAAGKEPGRAIRLVTRMLLDAQDPDWHNATPSNVARHYVYDPRDPTHYYVYPPSAGGVCAEIVYSAVPDVVEDIDDVISLDDVYANALVDYIAYRAFMKDEEYAATNRATLHYQALQTALGAKTAMQVATNPNASAVAK